MTREDIEKILERVESFGILTKQPKAYFDAIDLIKSEVKNLTPRMNNYKRAIEKAKEEIIADREYLELKNDWNHEDAVKAAGWEACLQFIEQEAGKDETLEG